MCTNLPITPTNNKPIGDNEIEINAIFISWQYSNRKFSHYEVANYGKDVYAFYHGVETRSTDADIITRLLFLDYDVKINLVLSEVCYLDYVEFVPSKKFR